MAAATGVETVSVPTYRCQRTPTEMATANTRRAEASACLNPKKKYGRSRRAFGARAWAEAFRRNRKNWMVETLNVRQAARVTADPRTLGSLFAIESADSRCGPLPESV